jgi:hypothetical protein
MDDCVMWTEWLCDPTRLSVHSKLVFGLVGINQLLHIAAPRFALDLPHLLRSRTKTRTRS